MLEADSELPLTKSTLPPDEPKILAPLHRTRSVAARASFPRRSHWPACFSAVLAGAGIGGGVYGASDKTGAYVKDHPVPPQVLGATIYHALGVPLDSKVGARPITTGEPIHELFS
jgi:hypothetical protein